MVLLNLAGIQLRGSMIFLNFVGTYFRGSKIFLNFAGTLFRSFWQKPQIITLIYEILSLKSIPNQMYTNLLFAQQNVMFPVITVAKTNNNN